MECGVASRAVRWLLDRHYGPEARQHIFVCAPKDSLLHGMAQEEGYTFLAQPAQLGWRGFGTFACGASADGGFRDRAAQRA